MEVEHPVELWIAGLADFHFAQQAQQTIVLWLAQTRPTVEIKAV